MWTIVFLGFAAIFATVASRSLVRGYAHWRGIRANRSESPELFWMVVGFELLFSLASAWIAIRALLE